jgi:diguanylate cyclase (GGDEF)-like protein
VSRHEAPGEETGDRLDALMSIAATVRAAGNEVDLLDIVAEEAQLAVGAGAVSIGKVRADGRGIETVVNAGQLAADEHRHPDDEHYLFEEYPGFEERLAAGQAHVCSLDDDDLPEHSRELLLWTGKHSAVSVPIIIRGRLWGELWAAREVGGPPFSDNDIAFLFVVAGHAGEVIAAAERLRRLEAYAYTDDLTGMVNRRRLHEDLDKALAVGTPVTVVMCDVNGLKHVNDTDGHAAGDALLRKVAQALGDGTRHLPGYTAARTGGDEFCVLAAGEHVPAAVKVVQPILDALAAGDPPIRVSAGAACSTTSAISDSADLLRAADTALYAAKRRGTVSVTPYAREIEALTPEPGEDRRMLRSHDD